MMMQQTTSRVRRTCSARLGWAFLTMTAFGFGLTASSVPRTAQGQAQPADPDHWKKLQAESILTKAQTGVERLYHFGSQGPKDVFSNHTSHSNRLIPFYTFGRKLDIASVTGANSLYRDPEKIRALYGFLPEHTVNPTADYADQSDFARVQRDAVAKGVKYLFIVWFDGLDWDTTRAAAIARTAKVYHEGKGSGLNFQDETAEGSAQFGFFVTSPTHEENDLDVDAQTVKIPATAAGGGYDSRLAGETPWSTPALKAPGYLKGQSGNAQDKAGVLAVGGVIHAYTDSAPSAAEFASGVKSYNNSINVAEDGRFVRTVFHDVQDKGWKVGTVTSVPLSHASPSGMYARNVSRNDYQDLTRDLLGLRSIAVETGKANQLPGLDVVIGTGFGQESTLEKLVKSQGKNAKVGNVFLTADDRVTIDARHGGNYVVVETATGVSGGSALKVAAEQAARDGKRLFGFFGTSKLDHLPYRTADGNYDPAPGISGKAEDYTPALLREQPTLADMTEAALTVLADQPGQPFALFVEAGDVDFALHDNNLDNAIGAIHSGELAIDVIFRWVAKHSNWDESAVIVTADHGHYLVVDRPEGLIPPGK